MRLLTIPPMTGTAIGLTTSAPVRVLHSTGSRLATMVATVMTLGRSRRRAPSFAARMRSASMERRAAVAPRPFHGFIEIDDHDDRGLNRRAEERDVANPDGDAERNAKRELQKHAAAQRERHGQQHVRSIAGPPIDAVQQWENDEKRTRQDESQRRARVELILVLAGVFDGDALRQSRLKIARQAGFHFLDKRRKVADLAVHVGLHSTTRSRPFSLAISSGPSTRRIVATWPSGITLPAALATSVSRSRSMSSRSLRCKRTWIGTRRRPSKTTPASLPPKPVSTASITSCARSP